MNPAEEIINDLRACHEYYCRFNCGLLFEHGHTPRCEKLQRVYKFPAYPPASPQDGNAPEKSST